MIDHNPTVTMKTSGFSIYPMLAPFPLAFFVGALVTDLVYWRAPDAIWETFSIWLITAGLIMAGFTAVAGLIDIVGHRRNFTMGHVWPQVLAVATAFVLAFINAFVHSRDGYTAVVPTGLILSGLVVVILIAATWRGREVGYRHRIGGMN